jgi:hypothetical protein
MLPDKKMMPYIDNGGCLIIPCNSDSKCHYWNGGQERNKSVSAWMNRVLSFTIKILLKSVFCVVRILRSFSLSDRSPA